MSSHLCVVTLFLTSLCFSCVCQGERSFFLQPGEHLEQGIQDVYVLSEEEGLVLRAVEAFNDSEVSPQTALEGEGLQQEVRGTSSLLSCDLPNLL